MGPGPPKQKGGNKNESQRALNTAGVGSSYAGSSTAMNSEPPSSPTEIPEPSRVSGEGWNRKRYQREDEALWGHDYPGPGQRLIDAIAKAGSSAGRLLEGRLSKSGPVKEPENPGTYYLARNPPVNDLHPPVVSTAPSSRDETRWMLQPPPPAKVMEGKERVNRSRAGSNGSSRKGTDGVPLSRQVTERLVDAKLQRGETPFFTEGRSLSSKVSERGKSPNASRPGVQRRDRSRSHSSGSSDGVRRKLKPPPLYVSPSARNSGDAIERIRAPSPTLQVRTDLQGQASRPVLSTILSSTNVLPQFSQRSYSDHTLQELSLPAVNRVFSSRSPSPSLRLSPNVNAMPASIPSVESKFPGSATFRFPPVATVENEGPDDE